MIRRTRSTETAAAFLARYTRRRERVKRGEITTRPEREEERAALRDAVLAKVGRLVAKKPTHLAAAIAEDWGVVDYRRVARAIAELDAAGAITRTPDGYVLAARRRSA